MNIIKLKKQARFFLLATAVSVFTFFAYLLASSFRYGPPYFTMGSLILSLPPLILTVLTILHAVFLLQGILRNESPFTATTTRHLQWIGWLFIAYEPLSYLSQVVFNRHFPLTLDNGIHMTFSHTYGGIFLVCGFVVLSVSTVFRYGMELQQLSDETI